MRRFFGMMPSNEIEIEKDLVDSNALYITIQAGPNGWSILWADGGSTYKDEVHSAEENYNIALEEVKSHVTIVSENAKRAYKVCNNSTREAVDDDCGESWDEECTELCCDSEFCD